MDLSAEESSPLGVRAVEFIVAEDPDRLDQGAGDLLGDNLGVTGADTQVVMEILDAVDQPRRLRFGTAAERSEYAADRFELLVGRVRRDVGIVAAARYPSAPS